jgi:hypothetical protein
MSPWTKRLCDGLSRAILWLITTCPLAASGYVHGADAIHNLLAGMFCA